MILNSKIKWRVEGVKKIIETSSCINFGNFGQGVDSNIITTAENKLNFTFQKV